MSLDISSSLKTHLEGPLTTLATCSYVKLVDGSGTSIFFTDHDRPIFFNGDKYEPVHGYLPSAQQTKIDLSVDNMKLVGLIDEVTIKRGDILAGRWAYADVRSFVVNYKDPDGDGDLVLINGKIGKIDIVGNVFIAELRGLTQFFQTNMCTPYTVLCTSVFGSQTGRYACKVMTDPDVWQANTIYLIGSVKKASSYNERRFIVTGSIGSGQSGTTEPTWDLTIGGITVDNELTWTTEDALTKLFTVTSVDPANPRRIFGTTLIDPDTHFNLGVVKWQVGQNQFLKMDVKSYLNSSGQIELYEPMPIDIVIGDAGSVRTGCDKKWDTCRTRYNNGLNYRGFPYLTGMSQLIRGN